MLVTLGTLLIAWLAALIAWRFFAENSSFKESDSLLQAPSNKEHITTPVKNTSARFISNLQTSY